MRRAARVSSLSVLVNLGFCPAREPIDSSLPNRLESQGALNAKTQFAHSRARPRRIRTGGTGRSRADPAASPQHNHNHNDDDLDRQPQPTIFDFGAKGDGATDDSAAFNAALAAAATRGQVIFVPSCSGPSPNGPLNIRGTVASL
jgi:hypothetical protein